MDFVSERNYLMHKDAAGKDALRLGVLLRSVPKSVADDVGKLMRMRVTGMDMRSVSELKASVVLHKVFFDSFRDGRFSPSEAVRQHFGSEAALRSMMLREAMQKPRGFVALLLSRKKPLVLASESALDILLRGTPLLAIDISEHAYYGDWGFDKEGYLKAAISRLDLSALDRALENGNFD